MEHLLQPGVVLDERYRVDHVLGEGGFGITYAAENIRIGLKVAVKELFWRNHSTRNVAVSPEVMLSQAQDMKVFQEQKERFLREARTLQGFSGLTGIVHVIDYFETNGTAYIVMERVEGETLSKTLSREGVLEAEPLFRRVLPLIESLDKIHQEGVIHRDISPDNIMVQSDGTLTLIDFGAAREYAQEQGRPYTTIAKASYSPGEQYDKNGRQGPWTDVYSLCATLYHCVVGAAPVGAVQRMFLDELRSPSEMGISMDPKYEQILMKGLQLDPSRRYQSMRELAQAIRDALPEEKPAPARGTKAFLIGLAVGLVCLMAALGFFFWRQHSGANKFRGIETERLRVTANEEMMASEFAEAQRKVSSWLEEFAGPDNYLMTVDGTDIDITLPLAVYDGREVLETTTASYNEYTNFNGEKPLHLDAQIQADWEAPQASQFAGKNQVSPEELEGETLVLVFSTYDDHMINSAWEGLIMDLKIRLDALQTPYAFGTLYGDDRQIVVRISPDRIGRVILDTIGSSYLHIAGDCIGYRSFSCSYNDSKGSSGLTPLEKDGQIYGFRYEEIYDSSTELEDLTRSILKNGGDRVYLQSDNEYAIAETEIDQVIEDGTIAFTDFCFVDHDMTAPDSQWIFNYIDALVNKTRLNSHCYLTQSQVLDGNGDVLFNEDPVDHYGVFVRIKQNQVDRINGLQEAGYTVWRSVSGTYMSTVVALDLEVDNRLPEQLAQAVTELFQRPEVASIRTAEGLIVLLTDEQGDERFRILVNGRYDYDEDISYNAVSFVLLNSPRLEPYAQSLRQWWNDLDVGSFGLRKSEY